MDGQDISPEILLAIGDVLGDILARGLPFNIQNLLGNWIMLIGQVIITFNAQQQYMENGAGQYYDICHKNSGNISPGKQENKSSRLTDDTADKIGDSMAMISGLEARLAKVENDLAEIRRLLDSDR